MIKKIKVAILAEYSLEPSRSWGGVYTYTQDLVHHLSSYPDLDVHVITAGSGKDETKKNVVTTHYLSLPKMPRFLTNLTAEPLKCIRKLKELKPDIIHVQATNKYALVMTFFKKKCPIILTVHGIMRKERKTWHGVGGWVKGMVYSFLEIISLRKPRVVFVQTPYVAKQIRFFCKGKIQINPLGVREEWFHIKSNERENRLLFVGGIEPRKGLEHLLKAVKIVKENLPVELHIVGAVKKEVYFNKLKHFVKVNNLEENVKFLGFLNTEDVKKEYGDCSIFILPSKEESQGLALLEAMAVCKPVVATNVGGIPFIVKDSENGFLVEYGNSERLAERIIQLLKDEKLRDEMGKKGRETAKRFSTIKNAEKVYETYKQVKQ